MGERSAENQGLNRRLVSASPHELTSPAAVEGPQGCPAFIT